MNAPATPLGQSEIIIEPGRTEKNYWLDLWRYRELFFILAWRDVAVRYKQTIVGVAWALVRPFLTMVVFTVIFGRLAGLIEGFRASLLGRPVPWSVLGISAALAVTILVSGAFYFRRMEKTFADVI